MKTILGIDPGSRITGFGVIQSDGKKHKYITSGCIRTKSDNLPERLQQIFDGISEIMRTHQPCEAGIEQVFMHQNPNSALKLGQARGAAIVAMSIHTIPVGEYSARQVKQSVVGYGAAKKEQVQHMVRHILNLSSSPQEDAADALAIAICHANMREGLSKFENVKSIARGRLR